MSIWKTIASYLTPSNSTSCSTPQYTLVTTEYKDYRILTKDIVETISNGTNKTYIVYTKTATLTFSYTGLLVTTDKTDDTNVCYKEIKTNDGTKLQLVSIEVKKADTTEFVLRDDEGNELLSTDSETWSILYNTQVSNNSKYEFTIDQKILDVYSEFVVDVTPIEMFPIGKYKIVPIATFDSEKGLITITNSSSDLVTSNVTILGR